MDEITAEDFGLHEPNGFSRIFGERIKIPEFEMVSNPRIPIVDLMPQRTSRETQYTRNTSGRRRYAVSCSPNG